MGRNKSKEERREEEVRLKRKESEEEGREYSKERDRKEERMGRVDSWRKKSK